MLYIECAYARVRVPSKRHTHKYRPCLFQFLHTVSAQYTGQVPSMVKIEGLWLSAHGRLPGTLRYMHITTACPVHSYHWDTWTEMGHTYIHVPYTCMLPMYLSFICSTGTLGRKWEIPMYQYTCTSPLSLPSIRTTGTLGRKWDVPMYQYTCMLQISVPSICITGTLGWK